MNKKKILILVALIANFVLSPFLNLASAASTTIVINEIAWAGSSDSSNDEWIELYNNSTSDIDLTGWTIEDDETSIYEITSGTIKANSYFVIEDSASAVKNYDAGIVINLSLANSGDKLVLKNKDGIIVDTVNSTGGAWFAGDGSKKSTMEKIDPTLSGDLSTNWSSAIAGNGSVSSADSSIIGTPGTKNSVSYAENEITKIYLAPNTTSPAKNSNLVIEGKIKGTEELFSYGISLNYDPKILEYSESVKGSYLNNNGNFTTYFQSGLENGKQGRIIIGEARTDKPTETNTADEGSLFTVKFKVIGDPGQKAELNINNDSFASSQNEDIVAEFANTSITVVENDQTAPLEIQNLQASVGEKRYTFLLTWNAPTQEVDAYKIYRKSSDGKFEEIASTEKTNYSDDSNIIPGTQYDYKIISVKGDMTSTGQEVNITETRGIKGDIDRSDRVDGRDLDKLARSFGAAKTDSKYNPLADLNYDSRVDGLDLVEMAANWATTY
ncbi:hypothetical protein A2229_03175 [Candidatus Peregrinibacteria bacterium RIFOXYA2_FULL_33_7]|nr:MAG: Polymorphic membrane protein [Candidatus Peregrinibacteria bacterium GW2011_GWC2_33_13]OGJ49332.1 MAG: hypothetical protein A2229_03175 [Candidatus Peregrinibacteria bacterium RIFOXYA2_FULL_33_7]